MSSFTIYFYISSFQRDHLKKVVKKALRSRYPDDITTIRTYKPRDDDTVSVAVKTTNPGIFDEFADYILTVFPSTTVFIKDGDDDTNKYFRSKSFDSSQNKIKFIDDDE